MRDFLLAACTVLIAFQAYRVWWLGKRLAMVQEWCTTNANRHVELRRRLDAAMGISAESVGAEPEKSERAP